MKNIFYKLIVRGLIAKKYSGLALRDLFYRLAVKGLIIKKYSGLALRDLFWYYEVNEHADKFLIEVEDRSSSDRLAVHITIPRQELGKQRSFLEIAAMLLKNLDSVFDWYKKEGDK